nr:hypothetical protein [Tanacetum cinerariifolium]
ASTGPYVQLQDDASVNIVCESSSPTDAETGADADMTHSEDQARPDPRKSCAALDGLNSEPMHDDFMTNVYPNIHESLKFLAEEHVIIEEPLSSIGTLSSMKNLDDAYTIGDQFLNDKSTKDDPGKLNVEAEVVSIVTFPIYQASSSALPLSKPIIDLSPPKLISTTTQAPIFTATTATTTTTLPLPPPAQQQSTTDSELAACVTTLDKKLTDFEEKSQTLDNTTQNLKSRIFTLELRDRPHKINQTTNESRKRRRDDQDPLPPPPDSDPSKKSRHDSNALGSSQTTAPQSSAWKTSDTRESPSSSSKQQSGAYSEQPVKDVPMPDTTLMSDSEDIDSAYLLKIKPRPEWLKPILKEDRPATHEPDWVIPPNNLPKPKNN